MNDTISKGAVNKNFTIVLYSDITKIRKRSEKKGNMQFNKQQNSV